MTKGDYDNGLEMTKTTENTVATYTFSKVHGSGRLADRLDVRPSRTSSMR